MTRTLFAVVSALTLAACGVSSSEVAGYQQSVAELQAAVSAHETDAVATLTAEDCLAEHQRYDQQVRPRLGQMMNLSGGMDGCGPMRGSRPMGMRTMCGSMQGELDRHAAGACAGDAATNHAEAAQHCRLMRDWLGQQQDGAASCAR